MKERKRVLMGWDVIGRYDMICDAELVTLNCSGMIDYVKLILYGII